MTKEAIIHKTIQALTILPAEKVEEVADFVDFMVKKHEEQIIQQGAQILMEQSETFDFLINEEDLYTLDDVDKKF